MSPCASSIQTVLHISDVGSRVIGSYPSTPTRYLSCRSKLGAVALSAEACSVSPAAKPLPWNWAATGGAPAMEMPVGPRSSLPLPMAPSKYAPCASASSQTHVSEHTSHS